VEPGNRARPGDLAHEPSRSNTGLFSALDALQREGRVGRNGMPGPLAFGVYLTEYRDVIELAAEPRPVVRGVLAILGAIGRRRGYDVGTAPEPGAANR
jgi:hypothetical protein